MSLKFLTPFRRCKKISSAVPSTPTKPRCCVTIEDIEDDDSFLTRRAGLLSGTEHCILINNSEIDDDSLCDSIDSIPGPETPFGPDLCNTAETRTTDIPSNESHLPTPEPGPFSEALPDGRLREVPSILLATKAAEDLEGYKDPRFDPFVCHCLEGMKILLKLYTDPCSLTYGKWGASSLQAVVALNRGTYCARTLHCLVRKYIADRTVLPVNPYGNWNESFLVDESLCLELNLYLQELGNNISANALMLYLNHPDVMERHGITRKISVWTARWYLNTLGFRFAHPKKGQYSDGHECEDVVYYQEWKFIPFWEKISERILKWTAEGLVEQGPLPGQQLIIWFHDESIFYAHNRHRKSWYYKDAPAKPYCKGDGHSFMIACFVSCDFGWLCAPDGRTAERCMFPGKAKDGYFTAADILEQDNAAIDLVNELYLEFDHVFIYNNATTHLKREDTTLSAHKMPKGPSSNFHVFVTEHDADGNIVHLPDGSVSKVKVPMGPATFRDGSPQELYCSDGIFKGMAAILKERSIEVPKRAECKKFKCTAPAIDCCCHRVLYNQLDFANVESILACREHGVPVILYRFYPESSREDDLKRNAIECLDSVPLDFFNRAHKFIDAYRKGLNGWQAAWAARKYKGHQILPDTVMDDLEKANIS
ncbi:hypothetical protein BT96DRAFT_1086592 [Gymnopus androsaceus JB14]|uniref:Uncharacterized protein n=1 Tax=Gymnopus androsaceus JB14 TaxID=1447944 RepID=A0A6A4GKM6_9AGAR|nr:hypothetical protein BT96DRAFT_1086592 [Gymnopus androsaceus JB14]